jgi:ABC-type nitrate/sulfonate/bicarbonate transport system substrate-binding protein
MTQPIVDQGIFRRLADCPTPWPCFVIAVRDEILEKHSKVIARLLQTINRETAKFKQIPGIEKLLAQRFGQKTRDLLEWLSLTEWSDQPLTEEMLNNVQNQLLQLGLIDKKSTFAQMVEPV